MSSVIPLHSCRALVLACFATVALVTGCASTKKTGSNRASTRLIHFPADQAEHNDAGNEWWYVVGHLHAAHHSFGYEATFFKFVNVKPPGFSSDVTVYRTDVAITDETNHRFHQSVTYYFPQSAHLQRKKLDVRVGPDSLAQSPSGSMRLDAHLPNGNVNLALTSNRHPMYVGGRGYLPFANGYTYYYSLTDISSAGVIRLGSRTYHVTGISWLDHQWGNWSWSGMKGWRWMALQLDDNVQLSVFDFRSSASHVTGASVLLEDGALRTTSKISIKSLGTWRSPRTAAVYPSGWLVSIPAIHASFRVEPVLKDQEVIVPQDLAGSYWEGSGRVVGTLGGKPIRGYSYTELTGYARRPNSGY